MPLALALLHAIGVLPLGAIQRLDDAIYDARLRATMPRTPDERIVIVDIDEKSLAELGQWPWGRNRLAQLTDELFKRQKVLAVGFDVVFAEPDNSSGLKHLRELAESDLKDLPLFRKKLERLETDLDYDGLFAKALERRPVVLGYYFNNDSEGRISGTLPAPVMESEALLGRAIRFVGWSGFGSNIDRLAKAAPLAGYFNPIVDADGVVRSAPLLTEYKNQYYESLSFAMFRLLMGLPNVEPGFVPDKYTGRSYSGLESIRLRLGQKTLAIPVSGGAGVFIPYRGYGGVDGGTFKYISGADLITGRLEPESLKDRIVLVGTTTPGLKDLRATPVGEAYAGVEIHASLLSGLLDQRIHVKPDYAVGYDLAVMLLCGLLLAFGLPVLSASRAVIFSGLVAGAVAALNFGLYLGWGMVFPVAATLTMAFSIFVLNMSYGYFVESRNKRELANLFGSYVPPELVDEMLKEPNRYSMKAISKELTVMFCDMRGFTRLSEQMEPVRLQALLTEIFSRLTKLIRDTHGTVDKYMGDCIMAFWGAPVDMPEHAKQGVKAAMEMVEMLRHINEAHRQSNLPVIDIGIGLNTGFMCVGDMGSDVRRAYTVIGDAVNLGSRLEGLSKVYGVDIVASESTRNLAPHFLWQELDKVRVKGRTQAVSIFTPLPAALPVDQALLDELKTWEAFLDAYRSQRWDQCDVLMRNLQRADAKKYLYELYRKRVASMRRLSFDPQWDGATNFDTN